MNKTKTKASLSRLQCRLFKSANSFLRRYTSYCAGTCFNIAHRLLTNATAILSYFCPNLQAMALSGLFLAGNGFLVDYCLDSGSGSHLSVRLSVHLA
ncbi:MAG: hypothetical protein K0U66_03080 [Gammaproteobacteria bacterium]|nr:hypothetical protein [Pseudomonadota bacterium]MCH9662627.1 hypothetical protein [Gammaproteobacteria bacterium]